MNNATIYFLVSQAWFMVATIIKGSYVTALIVALLCLAIQLYFTSKE